ncbi:uncharacterized protein [Physcomitrium patens]|uniref:uncharacterized protein isoform X3 n=1 Tax=Physcomitrium patens TaxID=3218 RepID=UPI000D17C61B|nr:serine/threonine-protein kinase PRP4 homolog isoform X3 [Physcomitrium patens]|eukprot:XP_024370394.1 serine/threonine-protein kinase PRP4 homolog isoform X3 [Physcomitrella patens]
MADTVGIILEYLHRHHFLRAEAVLREEVSLRQRSNGPALIPVNDDLDLDLAVYLRSTQEKTKQKQTELEAVPNQPAQDKLVTDVKPSPALRLSVTEDPGGQVEPLRPSTKGRIGGLSALQTEAEMAVSSSIEKVFSDRKKAGSSNAGLEKASGSNIGGAFVLASQVEKLPPNQQIDSPQALFEATRGKVDALKQRWEPKTADKPAFEREKSFRALAAMAKTVESLSDKRTDSNGRAAAAQVSADFHSESTIDVQLTPRDKNSENVVPLINTKADVTGAGNTDFTVLKSPEWADVPIKNIPPSKTSASLTVDSKKIFEERGKETVSVIPSRSHHERVQMGPEQEFVLLASDKQDGGSQYADVLLDELRKRTILEQSTVEETISAVVDRKSKCVAPKSVQEDLPKLAPVRSRSIDAKTPEAAQDEYGKGAKKSVESLLPVNIANTVNAIPFGLGSYLDVRVGQDACSSAGDEQSESAVECADEYWNSDTYEDDDDPGYHRQPIEDEEWFLAHEIDYPSDNERARPNEEAARSSRREKDYEKYEKDEDEDCSILEEEVVNGSRILDPGQVNRKLVGVSLKSSEIRWQSFDASKGTQSVDGGNKKPDHGRAVLDTDIFEVEDDRVGSVRFGGVGVSSDVAEFGSERRDSVRDGSSEGDLDVGEIVDRSMGQTSVSSQVGSSGGGKAHESDSSRKQDEEEEDLILKYYNNPWASHKRRGVEREVTTVDNLQITNREHEKFSVVKVSSTDDSEGRWPKESETAGATGFGGFSFPSPSTSGGDIGAVSRVDSGKSMWSVRDITGQEFGEEVEYENGVSEPDDPLASWRRKSNGSSPMLSPRNDGQRDLSVRSTRSASSTAGYGSAVAKGDDTGEGDDEVELDGEDEDTLEVKLRDAEAVAAEDEEDAAVQEHTRRIRAEEEEFETFDLKIIHRKNRTGFEEDKDFPVVINAVVAGRYHVTEYLGSAAFSKAIQAHDLHTGMDVCMKIIKNNKDFFDQSLDEIKLLKYINKHDPGDKHHLLRLYDYFYHKEHLFIVCELLRANLYEFHKYNRESGGEVYFTMPRLQSIARQCLESLEFIHGLGLIHCDLKPENILVKSYSRCEIKVIDFGSSCFQTDHLFSYVQSRSYRAPEVIVGLPYDQKIDMWSLGCILAELCSGNVLFQNDSLATLLARVVGILGPIDPELLTKGRDTHKFFTKNHMLYERNQDSDQLEYLLPKKTSLAHRLPMGDKGFVEFVEHLLNINPLLRPTASEALKHPWLSYLYEPISS